MMTARKRSFHSSRANPPPAAIVAATICWGALAGGVDRGTGQGLFCLSQCLLLAWLLVSQGFSPSLISRTKHLLGLLGLAWLWSIWSTWYFIGGIPEESYARMARDFGAIAALLSGIMLARLSGY